MKTTFTTILAVALAAGIASSTLAASVKKNPPKNRRAVEETLKALGEQHKPNGMKVTEVGTVKTDTTFYHIYCGTFDQGFRIIIFDNTPKYVGYYEVQAEPVDCGEGEIMLDNGEVRSDGSPAYKILPIGDKGPADRVQIDGVPVTLVKAPVKEAAAGTAPATAAAPTEATPGTAALPSEPAASEKSTTGSQSKVDYRDWNITMSGKVVTVSAMFVKTDGKNVIIKSAKTGKDATIPIASLSAEDKAYLKSIQ